MRRPKRTIRAILRPGERGDVLMEYVVVCGIIGIGIAVFLREQFYNLDKGYVGEFGLAFLNATRRVLGGISLPVP
jgi:hypothetical protein